MEAQGQMELARQKKMLPPKPRTFLDREELINYVRDFGAKQGYVVTIKKSRRDRRVILGCDRGGVYRNRRKIEDAKQKRKATSRLINCPFEAIGKKEDEVWTLRIKNGVHNHGALKDMSEHPYSRRFTEEEVRQIKSMTEAGVKPRQVLKALKQRNPELHSTPRHLYNLKAKIRQGNVSEKSLKSWRPGQSLLIDASPMPPEMLRKENGNLVKVPNLIGGKFLESQGSGVIDVINPATQEVVNQFPMTTYEEFKAAVNAARQAFPSWKSTPATTRRSVAFKFHGLILRNIDKLAMNISVEQGKTLKASEADVLLGLEAVEHTCGMAALHAGGFVPNASKSVDSICSREPLGVCAGICPSNFPATASLWIFPIAVTCGNTFVLKTCEKNPGVSMVLAELAKEAGLPDGVLNIVDGTNDIIKHVCHDEDIKAISFISSSVAGIHMCTRAAAQGKRVQANFGGKSYAIILPDANMDATLDALVPKGFGTAGQQGMALNIAIFVGGSVPWEKELVARAKALKVNEGTNPDADIGPVISREVKDWACSLVQMGVENGARLVLDGRNIMVPKYENGNFIGPMILCDVTTRMDCYKEEISGPVLLCMEAGSLEEAVTIVNRNKHAIGAALFTTSGVAARQFQDDIQAGLVGINTAPPFALPFFSLNGSNASLTVNESVQFYTQTKLVAQQWKDLTSLRPAPLTMPSSAEINLTAEGTSELHSLSENDSPPSRGSPVTGTASDGKDSLRSPTPDRDYLPNRRIRMVVPAQGRPLALERERDLQNQGELVHQIATTLHRTESDRVYIPHLLTFHSSNNLGSMVAAESSTSERVHMLPTSNHLNQSAGHPFQRRTTEATNFLMSERSHMPSTSRRNESTDSLQSSALERMCSDMAL